LAAALGVAPAVVLADVRVVAARVVAAAVVPEAEPLVRSDAEDRRVSRESRSGQSAKNLK
jgi:hypothetical protein